ncbi:iron complex transport system ATP-binding protein [Rhodovulum sp. ES.010]|uniref:heme ABC transporter ATP-binding protein n=1 Tax=Rhodovulum sp. ES.010 TaxID=1882821 RepID=UPI00092C0642|nr:heme ABC transporter ATP-binding protein [Rhodovulum sp. ES.010]SIO55994.1 iron complex transport system ATP-binding protein [Rhodovulum sp. ES.010]
MLDATHIHVRLGRRAILHGVDFRARPGELTAIVGPNGSGKTTLLRALTGDLSRGGRVRLNGQDLATLRPWVLAGLRAVLPQATPLAFPFTAAEVVRLGLMGGTEAAETDLVPKALARVGLAGFEGRYYQELSGGEQQRVQLARALAQVWHPTPHGQPRWLFLDEPVSSLDIGHQLQVMQVARDYADQGGGVVAVMHDLNLTAMFADRVTLLAEGRVLGRGAPAEVLCDDLLSRAYRCPIRVNTPPAGGTFLLPHAAGRIAAE